LVIITTVSLNFALPVYADHNTDHTISQLREKISELEAQLQLLKLLTKRTTSVSCPSLTRNLYRGLTDEQTGGEINALQRFLRDWNGADLQGLGIFGPKTEKAVQQFQQANGVAYGPFEPGSSASPGYGMVGPKTRAKIAEVCDQITNARALEIARTNGFTAADLRVEYRKSDGIRVQSCTLGKEMVVHPNTGAVISQRVDPDLCFRPIEEEGKIKVLQTPEVQALVQKYGRQHVHIGALDIDLIRHTAFIEKIYPSLAENTGCIIIAHAGNEGYVYREDKNLNIAYQETLAEFIGRTKDFDPGFLAMFYLSLH